MRETIHRLLAEPAVPNPPRRVWRDWALVLAVIVLAAIEVSVRDDIVWRPFAVVMCLVLLAPMLYRRTYPLVMVAVTLVVVNVAEVASLILNERQSVGLYTTAFLLVLVYAPFRWGSGRDGARTLGLMFVVWLVSWFSIDNSLGDIIGGGIVFMFPAVAGWGVRYFEGTREHQVVQGRMVEREQLARELHDTVAHYVSGIAIQAQAGLAIADTEPEAAKDALRTIEEAASRTLIEMRSMVGALRTGEAPELAPQAGLHDIEQMAVSVAGGPPVQVELVGQLNDLRPLLDSALYRLAQESITNARRHAKNATRVHVRIAGDPQAVVLTVSDDGEPSPARNVHVPGFGIMGMQERVALLGGNFVAGPQGDGWRVQARFPRQAVGG